MLTNLPLWKNACEDDKYHPDTYFIYNKSKSDVSDEDENGNRINNISPEDMERYLNNWFRGYYITLKSGQIATDSVITLKKCDFETAFQLYGYIYNPVSIKIWSPNGANFKKNSYGEDLYEMSVSVYSVDDCWYNISWSYYLNNEKTLKELYDIREKIMDYINAQEELNGEELLNYCESLGASDRNYG
jgi:hypothetical protein